MNTKLFRNLFRLASLLLLAGALNARAQNGVWTANANGNWSDIVNWSAGVGPVADGAGYTADFSTVNITAARTVTLDTSRTIGSLLFSDTASTYFGWTLAGSGVTLTLDNGGSAPIIGVTNATTVINVPIAGTAGLTKIGPAQLTLGATNTFTGGLVINGGTLFDNILAAGQNLLIPGANTLTLSGGIFNMNCPANVTVEQDFAGLTVNAGQSSIFMTRGSNGRLTNVYTGTFSRTVGGTLDIPTYDTTRTMVQSTSASVPAGLVNASGAAYVTQGGFSDWSGKLSAGTAYLRPVTYTASTATTLAGNANIASGVPTTTLAANTSIASLRNNQTNQLTTINQGGFTLTVGGILMGSTVNSLNGSFTFTNGTLQGPAGQDLVVIQNGTGPFMIYSTIADNTSATALTKGGPNILTLAANNTYSGATYLNAGTLQVGNGGTSGSLGTSPSIITRGGALIFNRSDAVTYPGVISGAATLTQAGAGTTTLTGDNTYSGATTISAGTLQIGNGGATGSLSSTPSIANNGALIINRSGTMTYPGAITGNGSVANQGTGTVTLGGVINGSTASVANQGAGTLVLNAVNTYGGNTTVSAGTMTLGASAFLSNSVALVVQSGATLDVSAQTAFALNGALVPNPQILAGSGTVIGSVLAAGPAKITPATNGIIGTLSFANDLTVAGPTLAFDLANGSNDVINVSGNLDLQSGSLVVTLPNGAIPNGFYKLIHYTGTLINGAANLSVNFPGGSQAGLLRDDHTANWIELEVKTAAGRQLTWEGANGNAWDLITANWLTGGSQTPYSQFDKVTFDNTGAAQSSVDLQITATPGSMVVDSTTDYTFSGTGKISGGAGLTKKNSNTLTVLTLNDNTGGTLISAGTVAVGNGGSSGSLGVGNITNNAALVYNLPDSRSVPGDLSGTGSLALQAGTLTLLGNNTYGATAIGAYSVLQVGVGGTGGTLGLGNVVNDGSLVFDRFGSLTNNGIISGSGTLTSQGLGTLTLGGANSYTGNTVISAGTVKLGSSSALGTTSLTLSGGATAIVTLDLNGYNLSLNGLSGAAGAFSSQIVNNAGTATNLLTLGNADAASDYAGAILDNNGSGGKISVWKVGAGTLTLRGANTFSGGAILGGGTVSLATLAANNAGFGSTGILMTNSSLLQLYTADQGVSLGNNFPDDITVPAGETATVYGSPRYSHNGRLLGAGTLTFRANYVRGNISGDWSGFTGVLNISGYNGGNFRVNNTGFPATRIALDSTASLYSLKGGTCDIGELSGNGYIVTAAGSSGGLATTWRVGLLNTTTNFDGQINEIASFNKAGTGTLTLNGVSATTGSFTVSGGTLALGPSASFANSALINVLSNTILDVSALGTWTLGASTNQTLAGSGTVVGSLVAAALVDGASSATVSPGGAAAMGTLTINGNLTLDNGVTNAVDFSSASTTAGGGTNDLLVVNGDLNVSAGIVQVRFNFPNGGPVAGVPYTLIQYTGTLTGSKANFAAAATHLAATFDDSVAGKITVTFASSMGANLVWQGDGAGNAWQVGTYANWLNGGVSDVFYTLDRVTFNDSTVNYTVNLTNAVTPGSLTVNTTNTYILQSSGKISGVGTLTKTGNGTLTIANTGGNDYTGPLNINGGTLKAGVVTALGATNSNVSINGGTLDLNGFNLTNRTATITVQGAGINGEGAIVNNGAQLVNNGLSSVALAADATFGGSNRWDIINGTLAGNNHNLTKVGTNYIVLNTVGDLGVSNITVQSGQFTLIGNTTLGSLAGKLYLNPGGRLDLYSTSVTNTKPVVMNGATLSSSNATNTYGGPISLGATEFFTATAPLNLEGVLSGVGSLVKNGTSVLTLSASNTYSGTTTISNGVLALLGNGSLNHSPTLDIISGAALDVSALSGGGLTLSSTQTLKGRGTVRGSLTAPAGSTVSPGDSIGTLTVTNAVVLQGVTFMEINRTNAQKADSLVTKTVQLGGTLTVVNLGDAPVLNDTFTLFSGTISGAFATLNLPALTAGLAWDTSSLAVNGTLKVVSSVPPSIGSISVVGGGIQLIGVGGLPGATYSVLASTNVLLSPVSLWPVVASGTYAADGACTNVIPVNPAQPELFYLIKTP